MSKAVFSPLLQIGGPIGFPDEWGRDIGELIKEDILANGLKETEEVKKTQIGGKTELKFDQKEQEYKEKIRVATFKKELTQAQKEAMEKAARRKSRDRQLENIIRTIGGITNLSYQDVMDENGIMRIDIETWFNKKNSEMQEKELKKQKQSQVAQATGKINYFMQHNMAGERSGGQHVLSAVG